jgi:LPS export ABC transporter protein LptC/lipopolysaccharide transport protein LptA
MTYNHIRFIKWVLAIVLVCFGALVAYELHNSMDRKTDSLDSLIPSEPDDPLARGVEMTRLDSDGNPAFVLRAAESIGGTGERQTFRDVEITFTAGKEEIPLVVTADLCEADPETSGAHLEGNVVIRDESSARMETSVLDYQRKPDRVWTQEKVRFFRENLEGESGSLFYDVPAAKFFLEDGVTMRLTRDGGSPVDIDSQSAVIRRHAHIIQFVDDVYVRQTNRDLRCNDLQLFLTEDDNGIEHIEAYENVEMTMVTRKGGGESEPETETEDEDPESKRQQALHGPGTKRLTSQKLEIMLREDGETLERARALNHGRLTIEPPPDPENGSSSVRQLSGYTLAFEFDEEGRLVVLRGRGGVEMTIGPPEDQKRVTARQLVAEFEPESGDLVRAQCLKSVEFFQGELRGSAEEGIYETANERLTMKDSPRLWDETTSLEAELIEIDVETGDLTASRSVRSTFRTGGESNATRLFPSDPDDEDEPVHFVADHLSYKAAEDRALYKGSARGFRGDSRIEAKQIELKQQKELEARDSVRTILLQTTGGEVQRTITQAQQFAYRTEEKILHYRRNVVMKNDKMTLKGRRVDVVLEAEDNQVTEIRAEGEVEIRAPEGVAKGDTAKYLPKNEEVRVAGDRAQLQNGDKLTEGKDLTFFLTDDRILVDGREISRTKTIYTSKPRSF